MGLVVVDNERRDRRNIDARGEQDRRAVGSGGCVSLLLVGRDDTRRALRADRTDWALGTLGTSLARGALWANRTDAASRAGGALNALGACVTFGAGLVPGDGQLVALA